MLDECSEIAEGTTLRTQVCIVGAGAAGIAMAMEFIGSGIDVILLESGGLDFEKSTQELYSGSVADAALHSPPDRYRQRRFGGSTTIWGGRCMPFDAIDFERRDYVADSGWPFGLEELSPYYPRANRLCEAGEFAYTTEDAFAKTLRPMIQGMQDTVFTSNTLERFSCPTDFGRRYGHRLTTAQNIRVLLHANVTGLRLNREGNRLDTLDISTLSGHRIRVSATQVVLAMGGLEIPRLLLSSRDVHPDGIGNAHDAVGRYYMCHVAGTIGALRLSAPLKSVWHGYDMAGDGTYCRRRLALKPQVQRTQRIGNFVARLHHPQIADPAHRTGALSLLYLSRFLIPYEYAKRLHEGPDPTVFHSLKHLRNIFADCFSTWAFAWHLLCSRKLADRKFPSIIVAPKNRAFSIDFHAEQYPNASSRVKLGPQIDRLGQRCVHVDWRYLPDDIATVSRSLALLATEVERSGAGHLVYSKASVEAEMTRYGAYGGHHIGTARMGRDPRSSVTDANARVHSVANLFVAGSALFPTSSQANPTLTLVALALRTAQHLKGLLAAGGSTLQRQPVSTERPGVAAGDIA